MKNKFGLLIILFIVVIQLETSAQNSEVFQVNFALWSSEYTDWNKTNNVSPNTGAVVLPGPVQTLSGLELPISISIERQFDGPNYWGLTTGIYPSNVMKRGYYVDLYEGIIKLSGLDLNKNYSLSLFGSKNGYHDEDFTTVYQDITTGTPGQSATLNAYKNATNTVELTELTPNSSGEILISVKKGDNAVSGYLNAMVVTITDKVSDLTIASSMIDPLALRQGEDMSIETSVQNIGEREAQVTDLRIYLSDDNSLDDSDVLLAEYQIKEDVTGLNPGESTTVPGTIQIPAGIGIGNKYIIQVVDEDGRIDESSETNNTDIQMISILEPPTTRYVSVNGSDETGDGSKTNPFATPQFAVDIANPKDTIHLLAGKFILPETETITLKSDLTLRGDGAGKTFIYKQDDEPVNIFSIISMTDASNIRIEGLLLWTIAAGNWAHTGIEVNGGSNIVIQYVAIYNITQAVIFHSIEGYQINKCSFIGELTATSQVGVYESGCSGSRKITNSIIDGFWSPYKSYNPAGSVGFTYNNTNPEYNGIDGNISYNSSFVDFYDADLHLEPISPCIDAGDPTSPLDPDGTRVDIGALSFLPRTIFVSTTGSDITGDGSKGNPFGTIQYGIDEGIDYDTIQVMAGNYRINQDIQMKRGIYFRGEGAENTTINRYYTSVQDLTILRLQEVNNVTIEGIRLTTGASHAGEIHTGIGMHNSHNIIVKRCVIFNLIHGIYATNGQFSLVNNTIVGDLMSNGGSGIYAENGSHLVVENNIINGFGAGIHFVSSSYNMISHNDVEGNYNEEGENNYEGISDQTGLNGNISADPDFSDFYAGDGVLNPTSPCIDAGDPTSPLDPDGTRVDIGAFSFLPRTIFVSTTGSDITGDGSEGNPFGTIQYGIDQGIDYDTIQVMAGNYIITEEIQLKRGIYLRGELAELTKICFSFDPERETDFRILKLQNIQNVTIENLSLLTGISGIGKIHTGIAMYNSNNIIVKRCVIYDLNHGIYATNGQFSLVNNTIESGLSHVYGSGIYAENGSDLVVKNNIIDGYGTGIHFVSSSYNLISYNDVIGNYDGIEIHYEGIPDQTGLNGNISADPDYIDFYDGVGVLNPTSPCIDAGDPTSPLDPDGTRADIGAIPYNQSTINQLVLATTATHVTCFGGNDGAIDLTVAGGLSPYSFSWSNGESTEDITDLVAGTYSVTVTDQNLQEILATIDILEPEELLLTLSQTGGSSTGTELSLIITASGGTVPYTYELDANPSVDMTEDEVTMAVPEGNHSVILTDNNGCSTSKTIDISDIVALVPEICVLTVDEGTGNLVVNWNPQAGIEAHNVYRESSESEVFELIATSEMGSSSYIDLEADPDIRSYRYKISALDPYGRETALSTPHKSMHLTMNVGLNDEVNLIWDAYEGFDYSSFTILRGPSEDNMTEQVATVPSNIFSYTDLNPDVLNSYYQIEVVSNTSCGAAPGGRTSEKPTSRSNAAGKIGAVTALYEDLINQVEIYPNPANKYLNIKLPAEFCDKANIELRDITGHLVQRITDFSSNTYAADVHNLNSGVYVLLMKLSPDLIMHRKIIVKR